jgi:hypothetical protein
VVYERWLKHSQGGVRFYLKQVSYSFPVQELPVLYGEASALRWNYKHKCNDHQLFLYNIFNPNILGGLWFFYKGESDFRFDWQPTSWIFFHVVVSWTGEK